MAKFDVPVLIRIKGVATKAEAEEAVTHYMVGAYDDALNNNPSLFEKVYHWGYSTVRLRKDQRCS